MNSKTPGELVNAAADAITQGNVRRFKGFPQMRLPGDVIVMRDGTEYQVQRDLSVIKIKDKIK